MTQDGLTVRMVGVAEPFDGGADRRHRGCCDQRERIVVRRTIGIGGDTAPPEHRLDVRQLGILVPRRVEPSRRFEDMRMTLAIVAATALNDCAGRSEFAIATSGQSYGNSVRPGCGLPAPVVLVRPEELNESNRTPRHLRRDFHHVCLPALTPLD